ncbi:uncharacterized protein B0H18DRAFT_1114893 [Fomitopsis serialis]|uniref:uncharacterized protein n=1 Tax=Fomitopsis serialis TaxID=139415 RepID=UPI002008162A|nr:uncharacterized protein B0H18DRAFT_1114893 [Neoantrodia serialis]KAH9934147.1 hypothetical protein B0H18DRAFT_1114893 [Neoantrodia serialis]
MSNSAGEDVVGACCGLCCICCGEGFTSWLQLTRCCPGSSTQAGCCGPCCKGSFDSEDDWVEKERARRQREGQPAAAADPDVVSAQPAPRASMEARQPEAVPQESAAEVVVVRRARRWDEACGISGPRPAVVVHPFGEFAGYVELKCRAEVCTEYADRTCSFMDCSVLCLDLHGSTVAYVLRRLDTSSTLYDTGVTMQLT